MSLTGCFFANDISDWSLTRAEILAVLYAVRYFQGLNIFMQWLLLWLANTFSIGHEQFSMFVHLNLLRTH